ncbi:MAG: Fic family protein [Acidobacteriota bacterium]|nr:Fic family protein [Acidobacteriota bacterium]
MLDDTQITWRGHVVRASVPRRIAGREFELPVSAARATERAIAAMERSSDRLPTSWEPLARLLLRSEGVASSAVEEVRAPLGEVAAAQLTGLMSGPAAWVADNLAVVSAAVDAADRPLSVASLLEWHRRLMAHATTPVEAHLVGALRDRPVWVGGSSPLSAAYVGPPHELVPGLVEDLIEFANADHLDAVTQAAVLHAQFESIHPFADGNGRLGRVLIGWLLVRRLGVRVPPPFSVFVTRDPGGYLSGLALYRVGEVAAWVSWFAATLERSATSASSLVTEVAALERRWHDLVASPPAGGRTVPAGATLWAVLEDLVEHPIVTAPFLSARFSVTDEAARQVLRRLASLGIVEEVALRSGAPGRPARWWAARELLDLVTRRA